MLKGDTHIEKRKGFRGARHSFPFINKVGSEGGCAQEIEKQKGSPQTSKENQTASTHENGCYLERKLRRTSSGKKGGEGQN